ncbi:hypothetical protein AKJ57_05055 [candidate division MSBL1 archaeon SCGC-AAA259A05]|uniref:DUF434 domain-containing protein n=1 Tax=candidate division MSBL1 archaeon SCGC-AAA259A05 TaxID=1698259 RepID=A0A133U646_9EURY|nr:hypothetical protein AKJ57_05055 [candidate division MSBL1 archaeon SCGC-AAA259A05]
MLSPKIKRSIQDLRYLLDRGYPRDSAVEFVSDHYQLELDDRHLLARCVFSRDEVQDHRKRLIDSSDVRDFEIGIDGYNVLITIESILKGERIVRCDDGFVRDLQAIFGKYKMSEFTDKAVIKIIKALKEMEPGRVVWLFDKQVSKSGELAGYTRRELDRMGLEGDAKTTVGTDAKVWKFEVSATSDRVVIERSERVLDIPFEFLEGKEENLIDLTEIQ